MIARLDLGKLQATLEDDGHWASSDRWLEKSLNTLYSPERYPTSPAGGIAYSAQAHAAAVQLKGTLEWGFQPLVTEERVY